ncbi:hypothetical protein [Limimaricola cinnabarinus]|uniref:hypothetical protein n=1 Tax=Limimaricola cinnabarinus TaxID=1125964 RepID=UPI002FE060B1
MAWLSIHSAALCLIINAAMLLVWMVYLNIFLVSYLRQRRQCILITQGAGAVSRRAASFRISGWSRSMSSTC